MTGFPAELVVKALRARLQRRVAERAAESLAVRKGESLAAKKAVTHALPAPPKRLALPAPGPKPDPRYKPRGGQWWPEGKVGETDPRKAGWSVRDRGGHVDPDMRYQVVQPDGEQRGAPWPAENNAWTAASRMHGGNLKDRSPEYAAYKTATNAPMEPADAEWLQKALTKYLKNDFGTEGDPLAALADRGLHYDPEMTGAKWVGTANDHLMEDNIGDMIVPPHASYPDEGFDHTIAQQLNERAPWLAKQPVTNKLYGLNGLPDMEQFTDFFPDLLAPEANNIPADFAVRRESLNRMSFPQAVEHLGKYRQWKAAEAERQAQAAMNNPALSVHKDYGDGMKWVQIRKPEIPLPEGWTGEHTNSGFPEYYDPQGEGPYITHPGLEGAPDPRAALQEALENEGDTMGHCVGGYCDAVANRGTGIYSLRDAKGLPHVTIETAPAGGWLSGETLNAWEPNAFGRFLDQRFEEGGIGDMHKWAEANFPEQMSAQNIEQIKGKQNAKPVDQYLPYVQDFVKGNPWARVEDLRNADMVQLPDKRYVRQADWNTGISNAVSAKNPQWAPERLQQVIADAYRQPGGMVAEKWDDYAPYFEGYKRGGLVKGLAVRGVDACQCS